MSQPSKEGSGPDLSQVLLQINLLRDELKKKADKTELQHMIQSLNSHIESGLEKVTKDWEATISELKHNL